MSSEHGRTPAGILQRLESLESDVLSLTAHFGSVVDHFSNGGQPGDIPLTPPAAPVTETIEQSTVANALAALTEEQKAALRLLLG